MISGGNSKSRIGFIVYSDECVDSTGLRDCRMSLQLSNQCASCDNASSSVLCTVNKTADYTLWTLYLSYFNSVSTNIEQHECLSLRAVDRTI
jgi:hypothetical protein